MSVAPTPYDDQDRLHQLVDEWLDAEPDGPRRAQLAAQLATIPAGRMWLATRAALIDEPGTPDLVAGTAAALRGLAPTVATSPGETVGRRRFFGTVLTARQWAAALTAVVALVAAVAGILISPGLGGGLSGTGAGDQLGLVSIVLLDLAVGLAVVSWVLWRRR
jgi:hypothetical protein